ncbi:hypothetical protein SAMN04488008_104319 [Maribacter orientalis]|uniref:Uncharacterized protein n=1 Tax=Maribacter orientalis TaxID=228957 RepID=A0A1H7RML2_9FLAO|nr:hypothetical protein SAMN04488008_104319 [Maribacter orientalis]
MFRVLSELVWFSNNVILISVAFFLFNLKSDREKFVIDFIFKIGNINNSINECVSQDNFNNLALRIEVVI